MKEICYKINNRLNTGTEIAPKWVDVIFIKTLPYSEENEEVAKQEAYNGEYSVEENGHEESITQNERISELEEALSMLLNGVTE